MEKDVIKEKIDMLRDTRNHLWNATVVTIGGTIAVAFNMGYIISWFLFPIGFLFSIIFFQAYFKKEIEIDNLITKLGEVN
ncbi:MAG TPA: hypothetical protein P5556_02020 [Candidatus Gastranaerophilales bacterium]|nr:hypothetical protein [Candidatus Gastranaerophilales bacterium]